MDLAGSEVAGTSQAKKLGVSRDGFMQTFAHVCSCRLGTATRDVGEESGGEQHGEDGNGV